MEKISSIAIYNLKHQSILPILVAAAVLLITPVLFGVSRLDSTEAAVPLELFVSLIGIVLLTPVFEPEQDEAIHDVAASKYVRTNWIYCIRTVCSVLFILVFIGAFAAYLWLRQCDVTIWLYLGTIANAVFLGALGMMTAALTNNTVIAYMIPLVYYALNYGAGTKLGNYFLFSMQIPDFTPKLWLGITGGLLIVGALISKRIEK
ncbi:MAG: hypothetical protein K2O40_06775, partial [Lachnospiraceae bacterium]|nr:hypothetical protein [Lachnospiraceae bacterium]